MGSRGVDRQQVTPRQGDEWPLIQQGRDDPRMRGVARRRGAPLAGEGAGELREEGWGGVLCDAAGLDRGFRGGVGRPCDGEVFGADGPILFPSPSRASSATRPERRSLRRHLLGGKSPPPPPS